MRSLCKHRLVEQTSVHEVIKHMGNHFQVPQEICRIIHVRVAFQRALTLEQLNVDKRLWDFHEKLVPNVDKALKRAGPLCVDLFIYVWIKACTPDKGDVRRALTATEAAECVRFGRCAGRNKECRWHL